MLLKSNLLSNSINFMPRRCRLCFGWSAPITFVVKVPQLQMHLLAATNCASMIAKCNDPSSIDLMGKQCGLTYQRCSCSDVAINCATTAALCSNSNYYTLMTQQCPKTCRRCGVVVALGAPASTSTCVDKHTGVSDCPTRASYCNNSVYYKLMTEQCPKTYGHFSSG